MPAYKNEAVTANTLRDWQILHCFTNEHAARVLRVTPRTYSRWRNGHPTPAWLPEAMANVATQFKAPAKPPKPIKEYTLPAGTTRFAYYRLDGSRIARLSETYDMPVGTLIWARGHRSGVMHQERTVGNTGYANEIIRPLVQLRIPEAAPGYFEDPEYDGLRWAR